MSGAYPCVLLIGAVPTGNAKPLQVATFAARLSETCLIAMQKVVSSNPISRSQEKPRPGGFSAASASAKRR